MDERECVCDRFERLEGAALQTYIADFLERTDNNEKTSETWYRCRLCSALWKRRAEADQRQASLVRLGAVFNV